MVKIIPGIRIFLVTSYSLLSIALTYLLAFSIQSRDFELKEIDPNEFSQGHKELKSKTIRITVEAFFEV